MMAIEAVFRGNNTTAYTKNVYQHDKGQMLVLRCAAHRRGAYRRRDSAGRGKENDRIRGSYNG